MTSPLVVSGKRNSHLNNDQSWCEFRMEGPLPGQWPALMKSGRRNSYLDDDQPFSGVWKEELLPE